MGEEARCGRCRSVKAITDGRSTCARCSRHGSRYKKALRELRRDYFLCRDCGARTGDWRASYCPDCRLKHRDRMRAKRAKGGAS